MATINLAITIPDAQMARVQAGMRAHWGQVPNGAGGKRDMTNAELIERLRTSVISSTKDIVKRTEEDTARVATTAGITEVETT